MLISLLFFLKKNLSLSSNKYIFMQPGLKGVAHNEMGHTKDRSRVRYLHTNICIFKRKNGL